MGNMLTVRRVLTELAGAAYAMQNAPVFLAATETIPRYSLASSRSYTATPAQLRLDVALGITLGRPEAVHQAAVATLAAGGKDDPALPMPLEASARTLAHLALGGMSMAELSAQDVVSACVAKRTVKYATAYFIGWADGAQSWRAVDCGATPVPCPGNCTESSRHIQYRTSATLPASSTAAMASVSV